jgi:spore cortex formation protein SpoVR/YcgB (stage V sporulation)
MTSKGEGMASIQVLSEMERKLDELIANANQLRECEEDNGECAALEHKQEMLLSALLQLNNSIDDNEKHQLWQRSPDQYITLEKKIVRLSRLNQKLLRPTPKKHVKKARVHKRKFKKPPTQLSLDIPTS